jgi:hypothetical protein
MAKPQVSIDFRAKRRKWSIPGRFPVDSRSSQNCPKPQVSIDSRFSMDAGKEAPVFTDSRSPPL